MKYSINTQIETEEFLALLKLAKPLVKALAKAVQRDTRGVRKGYTSIVNDEVDLDEADDDVVDGADHFVEDADNAIPFPRAVEPAAPAPQDAPLPNLGKGMSYIKPSEIPTPRMDHPLVIKGRDLFPQFINRWMEGFGDFDAPQPDRVDILRSTMTTHGGAILSYLRSAGGLVAGTREALAALHWVGPTDKLSIELASNIAQISSIFHPELTDVMEFIRPDGTVNSDVRYEQVRIPLDGSKE
jgi:hypothetical protein